MNKKEFPIPNRSDYTPSPYEPDADGVLDVGYYEGKLEDGRAYILECWQIDDLAVATIFFSDKDIEDYTRAQLIELLEVEKIIEFISEKKLFQCTRTKDDIGMPMWALNVTLKNDGTETAKFFSELKRYK